MMRGRWRAALLWVAVLALVAGPAAAGDFTGTEKHEAELACPAPGEEVPPNQTPPGEDDCQDGADTYQGYVWTNEVECADGEAAGAEGVNAYGTGDAGTMSGGIGLCNDGDTSPVQGRAALKGSMDEGLTLYVDGTKHNSPEQLQGWLRVDVDSGGPTVRCGHEDGKQDATNPDEGDTQESCG